LDVELAGQATQALASIRWVSLEKVPTGQSVHALAPRLAEKVPAGQLRHTDPLTEKVPRGQRSHTASDVTIPYPGMPQRQTVIVIGKLSEADVPIPSVVPSEFVPPANTDAIPPGVVKDKTVYAL
jgi:hypothetical protein